jgi:hypothetical protein
MTIASPDRYGVVLRKTKLTARSIQGLRNSVGDEFLARPESPGTPGLEDEHLVGFSVSMNRMDLNSTVMSLRAEGLVEGVDFVATVSGSVLGETPRWLEVSWAPTGNPPELEAKMTPEVRKMWQDTRKKLFSLGPSG